MILLDGKKLAEELYTELCNECEDRSDCKLIILTVGNDPASKVYVRNKMKACEKMSIDCENIIIDEDMPEIDFENFLLKTLSTQLYDTESKYYKLGIILQVPAPERFVNVFNETIPPYVDVDGFGERNKLSLYEGIEPANYPATPKGIITLLDRYNIPIEGKHVVIVGRSDIVGKPLAQMMLQRNATVTVCHSKTKNLMEITNLADILIVAIGKPKFINADYVDFGTVVIDVGINRLEDGTICGDVDFDSVRRVCGAITPVPGGVGPMTVYSLIENVTQI